MKALFVRWISRLIGFSKRLEELHDSIKALEARKPPVEIIKYVSIKAFEDSDKAYISSIAIIAESKEFRYYLTKFRETLLAQASIVIGDKKLEKYNQVECINIINKDLDFYKAEYNKNQMVSNV